ncbi:AfsA-related hotdog domain-containing protein [Streptomyces sp. NPDC000151]|uniref:AfsA-related hotdog domain-containing protein n=1 Tax=Streptomyces sp. NPDC000151 TaxID=3154244 RepID=UPI00332A2648
MQFTAPARPADDERALPAVDRWALPELFLTAVRKLTTTEYLATARIPGEHPYYTDRVPGPERGAGIDPLLLMECCRQAGPYGGREFSGIEPDGRFLIESCELALPGIRTAGRTPGPADLALAVTAEGRPGTGTARRMTYAFDMTLPAGRLGTAALRVRHVSRELYDGLRPARARKAVARAGAPVLPCTPVAPHLVGRTRPENVVLSRVAVEGGRAKALLRLPADNPALFDAGYDHVPAMVLLEAARQLALCTAAETYGALPALTTVAGLDLRCHRFAEPHLPVTVRLSAYGTAEPQDGLGAGLPQLRSFRAAFEQNGTAVAEGRLHLTTAGPEGRPRRPESRRPVALAVLPVPGAGQEPA